MTVRRRSAAEARLYTELLAVIDRIERAERDAPPCPVVIPPSRRCEVPMGPDAPEQVKDTIFLDAETAKWLKAGGRGYLARINRVLRTYMLAAAARAEAQGRLMLPPTPDQR